MSKLVCTKNGECTIVNIHNRTFVLNYKMSISDDRDYIYSGKSKQYHNVDLRDKMPPVWKQGEIGSCVAQCLSATIMYCMKKPFTPSRLFIYYCARAISDLDTNEDTGVEMRMGCKSITKYGFCNEDLWTYSDDDKYKIMPPKKAFEEAINYRNYVYEKIPINIEAMMNCLNEDYPFVIGIMVYSSMFDKDVINTGSIKIPNIDTEEKLGGHAITIVGYNFDKKIFIMRNSWGQKWGDKGYGTIPFDYLGNRKIALDSWVLKCKPHH
jgi:C1A family cysteine protease